MTVHCFSIPLTSVDIDILHRWCEDRGFSFSEPPQHALWKVDVQGCKLVCYASGKLVVQGKGADEFIRYTLETLLPHLTGISEAPESAVAVKGIVPHAGMDESGKGDFFGPLVITSAFANEKTAGQLIDAGVRDCKLVNDKELFTLHGKIKAILSPRCFSTVVIGNEAYNRLYAQFANLNKLLAWGHARALENLLSKVPECTEALADQFGNPALIKRALLEKGRAITLTQRTKAESDIAVAAASILARAEFLHRLAALADTAGVKLPKGAGPIVVRIGKELWRSSKGDAVLFAQIAKTHFSTYKQIQS